MRRVLLAGLLSTFMLSAPASAATVTVTVTPTSATSHIQGLVGRMHVPVVHSVDIHLSPCPVKWVPTDAPESCNFPEADSPIYVAPLDPVFGKHAISRDALYSELGGRFDTLAMTPAARWHFGALLHTHRHWLNSTTPGLIERFEDAYTNCAMGLRPSTRHGYQFNPQWDDDNGYDPSRKTHRRICALIRRMGKRAGL